MSKNFRIRSYIKKLQKNLKHLSDADRDEIVKEIEGHIVERWEIDSKGKLDDASLVGVLGKLGTPESIAAQYCEQRGWATPPPKHTVRNTILVITAIVLFIIFGTVYDIDRSE